MLLRWIAVIKVRYVRPSEKASAVAELRARGFSCRDFGDYAECTKPVNEVEVYRVLVEVGL
jgi:hypothetical protein